MTNLVKRYLNKNHWRVRENSNVPYSLSGLQRNVSGKVIASYSLDNVYGPQIGNLHREGDLHIHDLSFGIAGYCAGWSLEDLLLKGFGGVEGQIESSPPKHFDTALLQLVNFLGTLQNEWAGAQAFNSVDTFLAPFIRNDSLSYREVKQGVQKLIFNLNITSRWGQQTPFSNITLDWTPPSDLKSRPVIIGGDMKEPTYSDYQEEMDLFNRAFLELMLKGDAEYRPFTFPIPTFNITDDFYWENSNTDLLFDLTATYGSPYFSNFVNSDMDVQDIRSMCCRLRLDTTGLERNITGGLFGSGDKTGSQGVVTINLPRIGYLSSDEEDLFYRLENMLYLAKESLEIKRNEVERNITNGLLPFSKEWLNNLDNHFSTIGVIGMNELTMNFLGESLFSSNSQDLANDIMDFILEHISEYQNETGNLYNLEATPAEGTSYRLARLDKERWSDIFTQGESSPYYTNSTQLPVQGTNDLLEQIEIEEQFQVKYTGGTVLHIFLGELLSGKEARLLTRRVLEESELPYITITPTFSICKNHGYLEGENSTCPRCGTNCEVYSRVVGYYRPVRNWNDGKQEEFKDRDTFQVQ